MAPWTHHPAQLHREVPYVGADVDDAIPGPYDALQDPRYLGRVAIEGHHTLEIVITVQQGPGPAGQFSDDQPTNEEPPRAVQQPSEPAGVPPAGGPLRHQRPARHTAVP